MLRLKGRECCLKRRSREGNIFCVLPWLPLEAVLSL